MKKFRQNGFVLLLVIVALSLIGAATSILAGGANIMLVQSDTAYLQACERSIRASGLAWAKQNIKNQNQASFNHIVELDAANLGVRDSSLSVFISIEQDKPPQVQINTSCSRAGQTLKRDNRYIIEL